MEGGKVENAMCVPHVKGLKPPNTFLQLKQESRRYIDATLQTKHKVESTNTKNGWVVFVPLHSQTKHMLYYLEGIKLDHQYNLSYLIFPRIRVSIDNSIIHSFCNDILVGVLLYMNMYAL